MSNKLVKSLQALAAAKICPLCEAGAPPHGFMSVTTPPSGGVRVEVLYHPEFNFKYETHVALALMHKHMDTLGARVPEDESQPPQVEVVPPGTVFS